MKGVLLINLGTPDDPSPASVGRYLEQFLMDPHVIGAPEWLRSLLVRKLILPKRSTASAEKYQSIWTERGSPLKYLSQDFQKLVQAELPQVPVELGFRYGNPSIDAALKRLHSLGVRELYVLPMYPHHADSSVTTVWQELNFRLPKYSFAVHRLEIFYDKEWFLHAWRDIVEKEIMSFEPDHILFSYHGIPISHVVRAHPACKNSAPRSLLRDCPAECAADPCYIGQCRLTSKLIFQGLASSRLAGLGYSTSFQSRLGPFKWTEPNTVAWLTKLYRRGIRRPLVVCPSFVADCLETLEEIGITEKEHFKNLGGGELRLAPSLNTHPTWVRGVSGFLTEKMGAL